MYFLHSAKRKRDVVSDGSRTVLAQGFNMRAKVCVAWLCFVICTSLLAACGPGSEEEKIAAGKEVYINQCSHCHQPEGQGYANVFPHLAGNPIVMLADPEPTIEIVLHGRGSMPSYLDTLTGEQRAQVISYIRTAWGNNASTVTTGQAQ
jgi:mono/diheme cytochrome c family protein